MLLVDTRHIDAHSLTVSNVCSSHSTHVSVIISSFGLLTMPCTAKPRPALSHLATPCHTPNNWLVTTNPALPYQIQPNPATPNLAEFYIHYLLTLPCTARPRTARPCITAPHRAEHYPTPPCHTLNVYLLTLPYQPRLTPATPNLAEFYIHYL